MNKLEGRNALVTGAARGIGHAIALALAAEGANIAINYQSSEAEANALAGELAKAGRKTLLFKGNVGERATWTAMMDRIRQAWGRLDILVNNAGITRDKTLRKMTDEDWMTVLNTNLNACYFGVSAAMPMMIEQKFGRIINISSFVGQAGNFGQANYSASKGGIIAFTKTAAIELAKFNITCNALAPGFTETGMLAKVPEQCRRRSWRAFPWDASAGRRRSPRRCCSLRPTATTSPDSRSTSTAACTCRQARAAQRSASHFAIAAGTSRCARALMYMPMCPRSNCSTCNPCCRSARCNAADASGGTR
jgi:acetoacetyl-CoA reductase